MEKTEVLGERHELEEAVKEIVKIGLRFEQQAKFAEAAAAADRERKRKLLKQKKESCIGSRF